MPEYTTLIMTTEFIDSLIGAKFSAAERQRFARALRLLDTNERHPSPRLHPLHGDRDGQWSVSASDQLRITFSRHDDGKKQLIECSRHYH